MPTTTQPDEAATDATASRGHKKRERTRRRLIDAAIDVIGEVGEAFTISDVTERAEVANGTFYNYFDDRDALVDAVVPEVLAGFTAVSAATIVHDDPAVQFAAITASALRHAVVAPGPLRVVLRLDAAQRAILHGDVLAHLRADVGRGAASGRFRVDATTAILDLVAGSTLLAVHRLVDGDVPEGYAVDVVEHLLRLLGVVDSEAATIAADAVARAADDQSAGG